MKREQEALEEQAALWADRRRRREMDDAANADLRAWLASGPGRTALLRAHEEMLADPALAEASVVIGRETAPARPRRRPPPWSRAAAWGVGLVAAGLVAGVMLRPTERAVVHQAFEAPVGRPLSASLDDGSLIQLNGGSDIRTAFDAKRRDVRLRGEGFFAVAKDAERPFSVYTVSHRVTALGTRFNVDERGHGVVEISVLEGRIEVADLRAPERRIVLTAGHRIIAGNAPLSATTVRRLAGAGELPDWTQGWIDADDMRLADLLLELRRQTPDLRVELGDPSLAGRRVSGRFKASDPREVLTVVAATQGLKLRAEPSGRLLIGR